MDQIKRIDIKPRDALAQKSVSKRIREGATGFYFPAYVNTSTKKLWFVYRYIFFTNLVLYIGSVSDGLSNGILDQIMSSKYVQEEHLNLIIYIP